MSDVIKLYRGITYNKEDVRTAMMELYHTLEDPDIGHIFKRAVDNILLLNSSKSNLNFPIIVESHISTDTWKYPHIYIEEMHRCIKDLKETIRSHRPYGIISCFLKLYDISLDWLLNYVNNQIVEEKDKWYIAPYETDDDCDTDPDEDITILGKMSGDIVRGTDVHLSRSHKIVQMPSLETVKEEFENINVDTDLEDHIADELLYDTTHPTCTQTLPDKPNALGITIDNTVTSLQMPDMSSTSMRKNHQPLPETGVDKVIRKHDEEVFARTDITVLIRIIASRLPEGTSITISGKKK